MAYPNSDDQTVWYRQNQDGTLTDLGGNVDYGQGLKKTTRLMVRCGKMKKDTPFHPTMRINVNSGFCRNQWSLQFFREGSFGGSFCVKEGKTIAEMVEHYFAKLKRMNHYEVTE